MKHWITRFVAIWLVGMLVLNQSVWAAHGASVALSPVAAQATSKSTISYQGYLVAADGSPVNAAALAMVFRLYNTAGGGAPLWQEAQNVAVSNGLFSVLLGEITPIPTALLADNSDLWLGITVGSDTEMAPREKIASAPYALLANIPDSSVTGAKIVSSAITTEKIADNAVTSAKILDSTITSQDILDDQITSADVKDNSLTATDLAPDSVGASELAASSVGTSEVTDNSLTASDLAASSVGTSEVADNSLTATDLAPDSVGASELAASSVGTSEVTDNSLTATDLAPDSVGASELAASSVGTSEVADNTLTSSDLATGAVKADELDPTAFDKLVIKPFDFSLGCRNDYGNGHAGCERRYNFTSAFPNKTLFVTASIHLAGNEVFWHWIPVGVYNVDKTGFDLGFVTYTDAGAVGWYNSTNTRVVGYAVGY